MVEPGDADPGGRWLAGSHRHYRRPRSDYELTPEATASLAELILVQGTASATPSPPTFGDGTLALYDVRIPAGSTTSSRHVTRRAQWTTPVGGTPRHDTEASRNAVCRLPQLGRFAATGSGSSLTVWSTTARHGP